MGMRVPMALSQEPRERHQTDRETSGRAAHKKTTTSPKLYLRDRRYVVVRHTGGTSAEVAPRMLDVGGVIHLAMTARTYAD